MEITIVLYVLILPFNILKKELFLEEILGHRQWILVLGDITNGLDVRSEDS